MLKLKPERERRRWTQTRLAALTNIASPTLSAIENERLKAGPSQRRRIAEVFGLTESELFTPIEQEADRG